MYKSLLQKLNTQFIREKFRRKIAYTATQGRKLSIYTWKRKWRNTFRVESRIIKRQFPASKIKEFIEKDGILYFSGRLEEQTQLKSAQIDLEFFLDYDTFSGLIPIVRPQSPLLFAYGLEVHLYITPHSGVESTVKGVLQKMFPFGRYRDVLKQIKSQCTFCS